MAWFRRLVASSFATALTVVPVVAKARLSEPDFKAALTIYSAVVFVAALRTFKPDSRFASVRDKTLDAKFAETFKGDPGRSDRQPFRVYIFKPKYCWWPWLLKVCRKFGWKWCPAGKLVAAYSWGARSADPDWGKEWTNGAGIVTHVFETGRYAWYSREEHELSSLRMSKEDLASTNHVCGVLSLPIRRQLKANPDEHLSPKVSAVLAFDAITLDAASALKERYEKLRDHKDEELLDLAEWLALYF